MSPQHARSTKVSLGHHPYTLHMPVLPNRTPYPSTSKRARACTESHLGAQRKEFMVILFCSSV